MQTIIAHTSFRNSLAALALTEAPAEDISMVIFSYGQPGLSQLIDLKQELGLPGHTLMPMRTHEDGELPRLTPLLLPLLCAQFADVLAVEEAAVVVDLVLNDEDQEVIQEEFLQVQNWLDKAGGAALTFSAPLFGKSEAELDQLASGLIADRVLEQLMVLERWQDIKAEAELVDYSKPESQQWDEQIEEIATLKTQQIIESL